MSEPLTTRHAPIDRIGRWLFATTKGFALAGGLVLVALMLMSLASIGGRALLAKPVPGDYELVQLGIAVAVASFVPFCQMRGGHVIVDVFTAHTRPAARHTLDAIGATLVAVAAAIFAWRLAAGAMSLQEANDQTTILGLPTWWAVALMVPSFALFAAAGLYTAGDHWRRREPAARDANQ
jgi:TRAP-type C4-dicarboxylate transport system permease small subunit